MQENIQQEFVKFRKKQTFIIIISFVINIAVILTTGIYYNLKQRALTGALYLYDRNGSEHYLDNLFKMNILNMGKYISTGNSAIEKIGYGSNGYNYMFILSGEVWMYLIILVMLAIVFVIGIISVKSMTRQNIVSQAIYYKEQNKELEKRISQEQEYNEKQRKTMQDFIENIAHQIKTPLAAVTLKLEFMQELATDERMKRLVCESTEGVFRIRDFIRTLLNISRFENSKIIITSDEVVVGSVISESINNSLTAGTDAISIGEILNVRYKNECESAVIYADEMWLVEALSNIIGNSYDYIKDIDNGRIYISAECDETKVVIRVADNGKGLKDYEINSIFDRFNSTRNNNNKSSDIHVGIGLNLSKLIVEAHYGILKAGNSEEYGGAEFTVIIPRYRLKDKRMLIKE